MGSDKKIRFVTSDNKGQKLKRNVPSNLRHIIRKTAWVKRVPQMTAKELRRESTEFEFATNVEIEKARYQTANKPLHKAINPGSFEISKSTADYVALLYFREIHFRRQANRRYIAPRQLDEYNDALSVASEDCQLAEDTARRVDGHDITAHALKLLVRNRVIDKAQYRAIKNVEGKQLFSNTNFQYFCRLIERADCELARLVYTALKEERPPVVEDRFFLKAPKKGKTSTIPAATVETLIDFTVGTYDGTVSNARRSEFNLPFTVLKELVGIDLPLTQITREQARSIADTLPSIPAYLKQHYQGLTIEQSINLADQKEPYRDLRYKAASSMLTNLRLMFSFAVNEGWLDKNPFEGIKIKSPAHLRNQSHEGYIPFTIEELNRLFQVPFFTGSLNDTSGAHKPGENIMRRHRYWAPLISLFTGMRMNEILQLEKDDICASNDGIDYIKITVNSSVDTHDAKFQKRVKTKNSLRNIPIHRQLKRLGFIEWVNTQPTGRLFPEAMTGKAEKFSDTYSKRFNRDLKKAGIHVPRKKVFHSLRGNFNDAMRNADVSQELREAINGWRSQSVMDARYGSGHTLKRLNNAVQKVRYDKLILPKGHNQI